MKDKRKTRQQLTELIDFLQKKIKKLLNIESSLKKKKEELKELEETLEDRVNTRTSAERVVKKLLHDDIAQRKELEKVMEDALEYANGIIDTVRDPLIVLDKDLKIVSASRSFYQIFKVKPEDTEKQHIYDLGDCQWNIPKLRELLEDILPHTTSFDNFEVEHNFPQIGKRFMLLNARKIYRKANHAELILLAIEDTSERKKLEEKLKVLATHDELTGCLNFRAIMELLEKEMALSKRYQKKLSISIIDIDQLKTINDEYGHMAGNDALVAFVNVVKNNVRSVDIVGRYGGDEFIVVFPETDSQHASAVLERIGNDLRQTKIISPHAEDARELILHFSAGIAVFPNNGQDLKELIWVADNALLQAKRQGKNQTVLEKRKVIRLNPIAGTKIEVVDALSRQKNKTLTIANISKKGMLLLSTHDIFDEELICRMQCPKGWSPVELVCKVKHKSKSEGELYRIGVYFTERSASLLEKLSKFIESPTNK